jgi:hypothetical protein
VALTAVLYIGATTHPFEYDDFHALVNNRAVHGLSQLAAIWTTPYAVSGEGSVGYRPVLLTFWAVQYAWFGTDPRGYHLVSLLLHLAVVGLTWALAMRLITDRRVALAAAALVALHPMHSEAVNYISAQASVLVAFVQLIALLALTHALTGRGPLRVVSYGGALVAAGLALGVKETAVTFPFLFWLWDWFSSDGAGEARRRTWRVLPFVALVAGYLVFRHLMLASALDPQPVVHALPVAAATTIKIIALSLGAWLWPFHLSVDHGNVLVSESAQVWAWLVGATIVAIWVWRQAWDGHRWPFFALGWTTLSLAPVGGAALITNVALFQENRAYLAGVGLALAVAPLCVRLMVWGRARWGTVTAAGGAIVVIAVAAGAVAMRTHLWGDRVALWADAVAKYPGSAHAYGGLGAAYRWAGQPERAEAALREAWRLDPRDFANAYALGDLLIATGRWAEGMAVHERVVEATLGRPRMELLRGDRLLSRGDLDGAVAAYRAAQTQGLDTPELWLRLGSVSERTGRVEEARSWYQRVLAQPSTGSVQDEALKGFARQGVERLSALGGERSP